MVKKTSHSKKTKIVKSNLSQAFEEAGLFLKIVGFLDVVVAVALPVHLYFQIAEGDSLINWSSYQRLIWQLLTLAMWFYLAIYRLKYRNKWRVVHLVLVISSYTASAFIFNQSNHVIFKYNVLGLVWHGAVNSLGIVPMMIVGDFIGRVMRDRFQNNKTAGSDAIKKIKLSKRDRKFYIKLMLAGNLFGLSLAVLMIGFVLHIKLLALLAIVLIVLTVQETVSGLVIMTGRQPVAYILGVIVALWAGVFYLAFLQKINDSYAIFPFFLLIMATIGVFIGNALGYYKGVKIIQEYYKIKRLRKK